jgi:hypothetical protein
MMTNRLIIFRETTDIYYRNHVKSINTFWMQNVEFFNNEAAGKYIYRCTLKGENRKHFVIDTFQFMV